MQKMFEVMNRRDFLKISSVATFFICRRTGLAKRSLTEKIYCDNAKKL